MSDTKLPYCPVCGTLRDKHSNKQSRICGEIEDGHRPICYVPCCLNRSEKEVCNVHYGLSSEDVARALMQRADAVRVPFCCSGGTDCKCSCHGTAQSKDEHKPCLAASIHSERACPCKDTCECHPSADTIQANGGISDDACVRFTLLFGRAIHTGRQPTKSEIEAALNG